MSPLGIGTDLGGSIRAPAAWTGVFGMRASRDAVPHASHDPLPLSAGSQVFGGVGPLAAPRRPRPRVERYGRATA